MGDWTSDSEPQLHRIASTLATVPDLDAAEHAYVHYLRHNAVERGVIDRQLADHWGVPAELGSRYVTLTAEGETDVFVRLVERGAAPDYRPLTTFGWNAFEIIVDDVHALSKSLEGSPFRTIGEPAPLQFMPSIIAMQVVGPGSECLYFTMESGDREASIIPPPSGFVGRTFIVVCAGKDFTPMLRWYGDRFDLRERPVRQSKVRVLQDAQGLGRDQCFELSAIGMRQRGNLLELDAYPTGQGYIAGPRPTPPGKLPLGNALVSVEVESIDAYSGDAIAAPIRRDDAVYRGRASCTIVGPAGELLELIEAA